MIPSLSYQPKVDLKKVLYIDFIPIMRIANKGNGLLCRPSQVMG